MLPIFLDVYMILQWGFPGGTSSKKLPAHAGEEGLIPGSGRSSREYEMIAHSSSLFKKKLIYLF